MNTYAIFSLDGCCELTENKELADQCKDHLLVIENPIRKDAEGVPNRLLKLDVDGITLIPRSQAEINLLPKQWGRRIDWMEEIAKAKQLSQEKKLVDQAHELAELRQWANILLQKHRLQLDGLQNELYDLREGCKKLNIFVIVIAIGVAGLWLKNFLH